ncbi:MAG: amino acid adenylation domain-containing protein [Flammeovirgaceae bacterium]
MSNDLLSKQLKGLTVEQREKLNQAVQDRIAKMNTKQDHMQTIVRDDANRYSPFPLTDMQQAYWVGRNGTANLSNPTHVYTELVGKQVDVDQLNKAWNTIIKRHDMLRVFFLPNGTQQILEEVPPYQFEQYDLQNESQDHIEQQLNSLRAEMSHQRIDITKWPLFDLRVLHLPDHQTQLNISMDGLMADGWSYQILIEELFLLYQDAHRELPPLSLTFRDYVIHERKLRATPAYQTALNYWKLQVKDFPAPPKLPMKVEPSTLKQTHFARASGTLERDTWNKLKQLTKDKGLTPSVLLLTVFSEIIGTWSSSKQFLVNVPRFNRPPIHPEINKIVGEFASFSLLAISWDSSKSFLEHAHHIKEKLWHDLEHALVSGVQVIRELAKHKNQLAQTTAPIVFTCFSNDAEKDPLLFQKDGPMESTYSITQTSQVWLDHHVVWNSDGPLHINWDFIKELFPAHLFEHMHTYYVQLLRDLAQNKHWDDRPFSFLAPTIPEAIGPKRVAWQHTEKSIFGEFQQVVQAMPNQTAIALPKGKSISYQELYEQALKVAQHLQTHQVHKNTPVGICITKGAEQVAAILGIIAAGGTYLPFDPMLPEMRFQEIAAASGVSIIIGDKAQLARLENQFTGTWIDCSFCFQQNFPQHFQPTPAQGADALLYIMYTSGSTGFPKGVMIRQRGVLNAILATKEAFHITAADRIFGLTGIHHDMSVFDLFCTLLAGATLVIPTGNHHQDPKAWLDLLLNEQVTIWNSVPASMALLLDQAMPHVFNDAPLRLVFLGGDWIPVNLPKQIQTTFPSTQVISVGGPTETTLWNIWYPIQELPLELNSIPYGKPIANTTYYVLDEFLNPCPTWMEGEMWVAGIGLAQGYLNDSKLTDEKFKVHPITKERIYRTGDLGRFLPDGNIEITGRIDRQLKLNGVRIDAKEIERHLLTRKEIKACVVDSISTAQKVHLTAFIQFHQGLETDQVELRAFLLQRLPKQMVPSKMMFIDHLPLTMNGKVDRKALRTINWKLDESAHDHSQPVASAELSTLIAIVTDVLDIQEVHVEDDLFKLGATSVDLIQMINLCEQRLNYRPDLSEIFQNPTIRGFVQSQTTAASVPSISTLPSKHFFEIPQELSYPTGVVADQTARELFRASKHYLRDASPGILLPQDTTSPFRQRRSVRTFAQEEIPFQQFAAFINCLAHYEIAGQSFANYASPGGLYPCQAYIHVKDKAIEGIEKGFYYYHPIKNMLSPITLGKDISEQIHVPLINRPIFNQSGFTILLIANLNAIQPLYGEESAYLATLEAGYISQLLMLAAPQQQIGLCPIGKIDFLKIRPHLALSDAHILTHTILGGKLLDTTHVEYDYEEGSI